jgi:hypothetical protein
MATIPSHPLAPPTVSGSELTVDVALQQPTRINRMISDLTLQRFLLDRVFTFGGSVNGGAVVYDEATENELYTSRDVEPIAPAGEYPIVESERNVPKIAPVEKYGGRVFITDEARDRNEVSGFQNKVRQLGNSIVRKMNTLAIAKLDTAIAANSRTGSTVSWADVVTAGSSASSAELWPLRTFSAAMTKAETDELGIVFDLVILNPVDYGTLITIYGANGLRDLLAQLGFEVYVTNRQTSGKVKFVAKGQVGGYRLEQPLQTVTYRADGEHTDRTWVKSSVRPVFYVDNPFAVFEYTGLQA